MSYIIVFLLAIEILIVMAIARLAKIYDVLLDIKEILYDVLLDLKEISEE